MKIIRAKDYQDMSRKAANIISAQVIMKPDCVLGLATGGTPVGTYAQLVDWYNKGDLDFSEVTTVNLDEYRGLPKEHPQSYWYFMNENLFSKVNIDPAKTNLPDGTNLDTAAECARYNGIIHKLGGIDLQLLGIGPNGHIGFNEPGEAFELETHCIDLAPTTIEANKRFFDGNENLVPKQAYTMGIKTIMQARKVLVVANGKAKAQAVKDAVTGIGPNGHIGFNEPGEAFELETHCIDLAPTTIEANKRFFDGNENLVPKQAYTMGIKTIMQARKVLVVANGKAKAQAVKDAVTGPVTPACPGSILQLHPDCILVADEEALSLL